MENIRKQVKYGEKFEFSIANIQMVLYTMFKNVRDFVELPWIFFCRRAKSLFFCPAYVKKI